MTSLEQLKQLPTRNYSVKIKQRFNTIKISKLSNTWSSETLWALNTFFCKTLLYQIPVFIYTSKKVFKLCFHTPFPYSLRFIDSSKKVVAFIAILITVKRLDDILECAFVSHQRDLPIIGSRSLLIYPPQKPEYIKRRLAYLSFVKELQFAKILR